MQKLLSNIFILVFVFSVLSCDNPFATREPEPPSTIQSNWIQPTSPKYVLINLQNAIEEKNKSNYLRCLADTSVSSKDFRFVPEQAVMAANPGVFSRWNKDAEANYINQLYSTLLKDSLITVKFTTFQENPAPQDSAITIQNYSLTMHDQCDEENCLRVYQGRAEFRLIRTEDDFWYIYRWDDTATSDSLTWSDHKARFGK